MNRLHLTLLALASLMMPALAIEMPKTTPFGAPVKFELWQTGGKKLMDLTEGMDIPQAQIPKAAVEVRFRVGASHDLLHCVVTWTEGDHRQGWGPETVNRAASATQLYFGTKISEDDAQRGGMYCVEVEAKDGTNVVSRGAVTFRLAKKFFYNSDITTSCDEPTGFCRLLFPGGLKKAVTMSFDDGTQHDRRLVEIFNKHGIRGTFNLISAPLDQEGYITRKEIKSLYAGHEVASHTVHHPPLPKLTDENITREVMDNRMDLESLIGYPVRGLAYPGGEGDERVANFLPKLGIVYARLVGQTESLSLPRGNPGLWSCTWHHAHCLQGADKLLSATNFPALLSIWGHSYEFNDGKNWNLIEDFCTRVGGHKDFWYATNIEVFDYMTAVRRLIVAADGTSIENPSSVPIWIDFQGQTIKLPPGELTHLSAAK